jgi:hypothetical protein
MDVIYKEKKLYKRCHLSDRHSQAKRVMLTNVVHAAQFTGAASSSQQKQKDNSNPHCTFPQPKFDLSYLA